MTEARLVGPFPSGVDPDEYDRQRRRILWSLPSGLYVLGSRAGDRRNLMTLSWAVQVATDPKLLAVSVEVGAVTHDLLSRGGVFSVNVLRRDDRAVVRKFVKPLGDDLAGFEVFSSLTGAPILRIAAAWLDCEVRQTIPCGSHTVFVGEVMDCASPEESALGEVLRMEDTRMSYGG